MELLDWSTLEPQLEAFAAHSMGAADPAHDAQHLRRVVAQARALAAAEDADLAVVLPAAWLHDCVTVPKDSPERAAASRLAAEAAAQFLGQIAYPARYVPAIAHAIAAHSFSAGIAPRTLEACVVQDADRLDAVGAIGIARCLMLGGALGKPLYQPDEPFPTTRPPDDARFVIDHFYAKLLGLAATMRTAAGRSAAAQRVAFMQAFLAQLGREIGAG